MPVSPPTRLFVATSLALLLSSTMAATPAVAPCQADSGTTRGVLVELYTSEGCSSCPPADRSLRSLASPDASSRVVPLALHVDYWDSIGWKDPYAQPGFAKRQAWEVAANRHRTSFTPHFFVDGREVGDWHDVDARSLPAARPAGARIAVRADARGPHAWIVSVEASVDPAARAQAPGPLQLYLAITESGLASSVTAGENRGARLEHDHVVRRWIGPIDVDGPVVRIERTIESTGEGPRRPFAIAAFLQDAKTAEVWQAVRTPTCTAGDAPRKG